MEWLASVYKSSVQIPAFLTCVDIAGLTKGAASGAGLGNNFLSNVRAVDGIFEVVRKSLSRIVSVTPSRANFFFSSRAGAFDDADVIHVEGDVDPVRDMEIIQTELRFVDPWHDEGALRN